MSDDRPMIENSAKAIILSENRILLVRYVDTSDLNLGTWYSLPGGRQKYGETLEEAIQRESLEEIGATVTVGPLLFVREYIHSRHELKDSGRDQHKIEFMFRCELQSELKSGLDVDPDQNAVLWVDVESIESTNVFPTGLKNLKSLMLGNSSGQAAYWGSTY